MWPAIIRGGVLLAKRQLPRIGSGIVSRVGGSMTKKFVTRGAITEAVVVNRGIGGKVASWLKKPGFTRDFLIWTGADAALDYFMSDDSVEGSDKSDETKSQLVQLLAEQADDVLGYSALRNSVAGMSRANVDTDRTNHMEVLLGRTLFKIGRSGGAVSPNELVNEFDDLTIAEKLYLNNQLVGVIKLICASGRNNESLLLASRQALCSVNPSPVFAVAADIVIERSYSTPSVENQAQLQNHMYEGLVDELAQSSFDEAFDEGSDAFSDFFDVFGSGNANELSEEIKNNIFLSHMNYKGSPTAFGPGLMSWFREMTVDSSGKDDESDVLRRIQSINSINPRMTLFVNSLRRGERNRADEHLT